MKVYTSVNKKKNSKRAKTQIKGNKPLLNGNENKIDSNIKNKITKLLLKNTKMKKKKYMKNI